MPLLQGARLDLLMWQEAKHMGLPLPAVLIVSGNRAPHLAGPHHDVDPTTMHSLSFAGFWRAFEGRYGPNADLVPAPSLCLACQTNLLG